MGWWTALLSPITSVITNHQNNKAAEKQRKDELERARHEAKVDRIKRGDETESDYDLEALKQSKNSWADELLIIWLLVIVSLVFIPSLQPFVIAGFEALNTLPYWVEICLVGAFASKLGLRWLISGRTLFNRKK